MKTILLAAALAVVTLASNAQADQPAVLRGVAKKQTLTTQQMRTVRGEGCGPLASALVKAKVNACVNAKVNVPCLLNVNAHVPVNANVNLPVNVGGLTGTLPNLPNLNLGGIVGGITGSLPGL